MNILVAMGSFKDVFSPVEMTAMVADALFKHDVTQIPMCDGGEYTYDVIKYHKKCKDIHVKGVINPYGEKVTSKYLAIEDTAYVISSEIIRLIPDEDKYMNPMLLTDYGLGQLCMDAIDRGYKKINLCLGGTSTVGFGMGFAQAMGAVFYDYEGNIITKPIAPKDLNNVRKIKAEKRNNVSFLVINDGVTSAYDLPFVNPQKIGRSFSDDKSIILEELDATLGKVCSLTRVSVDTPFAGNAGGMCFGIELVALGKYVKGTDFFMDSFGFAKKMRRAELIITGEGRLDNVHTEKLPVSISMASKMIGKKCLYICGQRGSDVIPPMLSEYGIDDVLCCCDYYSEIETDYVEAPETYRRLTPIVLRQELCRRYE